MPAAHRRDPACRSTSPARGAWSVPDVIDLLERYAAADRALSLALDGIGLQRRASRRVSRRTVSGLTSLIEQSLLPGVRAREELGAVPPRLLRAGIAAWAAGQGATRASAGEGLA
jgi:hypothetical protein